MNSFRRFALLVLCYFGCAATLMAAGFSSTLEGISAIDFPRIGLSLRIFTPEPITLTSDAFTLTERGTRIATFAVEMVRKEPLVALLLDRSSSMEPVIGKVRDSAASFVQATGGKMKIALLTFATDIDLAHDFTLDTTALAAQIGKMRPWGGTALYDGLFKACEQLAAQGGRDDQKTIVLLTDGKDESPQGKPNFSVKKPDEVFALAARHNIRIISVALGTNIDEAFLKRLAVATKGAFLVAPTAEKLQSVFQTISQRMLLERRYRLSYLTPDPRRDGSKRELQITSDCKGAKDQGTGSYVAPADPVAPGSTGAGGTAASGSLKVKTDLSLGRLQSPDLGKAGKVDHLGRVETGSYTPVATLSTDNPITREGMQEANKVIEETNRRNQELYQQNQRDADRIIDEANKQIDRTNADNEEQQQQNQQSADEATENANQAIEEAENNGNTEVEVPMPDVPAPEIPDVPVPNAGNDD